MRSERLRKSGGGNVPALPCALPITRNRRECIDCGPSRPIARSTVRPIGIVGWILIVVGAVVLALGGVSYIKERESAQVGPIKVATERRGFIPPVVGVAAVALGIVLLVADRRGRRT